MVAQDTTRYGMHLYGKPMLPELLHRLAQIENLRWIRVLYTYPDWITDELLEVMAEEDKIVKYLDIPLQHCDQKVLREMNRRGDRQSITALIEKIREKVPGIVLRTTLITGFPGETEEQFESLCQFVQDIKFERLGCFAYSAEEGTPAGERADQVEPEVRQRRADIIMELQMGIMEEYNRKLTGTDLEVVVEGYDRYASSYFGRSAADAPDIDGKIFFTSKKKLAVGQYPVSYTHLDVYKRQRSHITQKKGELTDWEQQQVQKGGLAWGCDICNEVCPYNRPPKRTDIPAFCQELDGMIREENLPRLIKERAFGYRGIKVLQRNLRIIKRKASGGGPDLSLIHI